MYECSLLEEGRCKYLLASQEPGVGSLGAEGLEKVARNLLHPQVKLWPVGCW